MLGSPCCAGCLTLPPLCCAGLLLQAASERDRFGVFVEAPREHESYVSKNRRREHYNRLVRLVAVGSVRCSCKHRMPACPQAAPDLPVVSSLSTHLPTAPPRPTAQVALPLSLTEVGDRLRARYYRQPEALASDIETIASNAAAFNGEDSELAADAQALAEYLTLVLRGQVRALCGGAWQGNRRVLRAGLLEE